MTEAERPSDGPHHGLHPNAATPRTRSASEGGRVVAAGAGLSALCAAVMLARHGAGEHGTRKLLRATARISMALFCAAFSAGSLDQLLHSRQTRWMVRNRRHLGLGFAASQAIHLAAIVRVFRVSQGPRSPVTPAVIAGGSIGYGFIVAMAATSNDAAVRRLGAARWKRLHTTGGRYLLATFLFDVLNGYFKNGRRADVYGPLAALPLATIACRHLARRAGHAARPVSRGARAGGVGDRG
jgi:DMSO/TMAO reductase YedYZ heme-binding membrane subunit